MFGKYTQDINTSLDIKSLKSTIKTWSEENKLKQVSSTDRVELYKFGSSIISNPIYIELNLQDSKIVLNGWVQTVIPFLRWKLVPTSCTGIGTIIDYRRKGGLLCNKLVELIA